MYIKGYQLKMRAVYAHFPINLVLSQEGTVVEVRNFLGEKYTRTVRLRQGVTAETTKVKDEIIVKGNDIELVTQSGKLILERSLENFRVCYNYGCSCSCPDPSECASQEKRYQKVSGWNIRV